MAGLGVCDNDQVAFTQTCLCLLTRVSGDGEPQVLLGYKKTGLGTGKIVALGGHVEERETAAQAAAREVKEESGIAVAADSLREAAHITFLFPTRPAWDMTVEVFITGAWSGEPAETDEIRPEWFPVAALPFDRDVGRRQALAPAGAGGRAPARHLQLRPRLRNRRRVGRRSARLAG